MKTITLYIASLILLISINTVSAQYGTNGYGGGGYGGNGYGSNNRMNQMGGMNQRSEPEKPKEIPNEEIVAKFMEEVKPALSLDELQHIAISNVVLESVNAQGRILKLNLTQEEQMKEFQLLSENTDKKINNYLNKDQKDKYLAFKEDRKNPKKTKSKQKKK